VTLHALASAHGVATSYQDWSGRTVQVAPTAIVQALAALDVDASSDEAVQASLRAAHERPWSAGAPPVLVVRQGRPAHLECVTSGDLQVHLVLEDGSTYDVTSAPEEVARRGVQVKQRVELPEVPLGYHRAVVRTPEGETDTALIVVPARVPVPEGRQWGWQVQLYALRSAGSWGIGDYADLRTVVSAAAADGAGAILVNPLHAETPALPVENSPYSPSSRLFRSALHLRLEDCPEWDPSLAVLKPQGLPDRIDRDLAWTAKLAALEAMWPSHRGDALAEFRTASGEPLERFASFCALAEKHGPDWRQWPDAEPAVAGLEERVAFWCWVQLLIDEQLAEVGDGLAVGVIHDLAVGVAGGGADAWALRDVLAFGTTIGAPPDSFNQKGQDWGLPPWRPDRLREQAYQPFRQMVQSVLRHAGGIRIDHVMGLSRLWWVPAGADASEGTYVSYDSDALLGVLALEADRAGAVVVGEDLGTVDPAVRDTLDDRDVLGSEVLWFARDLDGAFLPPAQWRRDAVASVTTHDLPTVAGWLCAEHVRVRAELGLLGHPVQDEQAAADADREQLLAMLRQQGLLEEDLVLSLHRALVASPCRIVLAAYSDAVGDLRQPNLPGTVDQYPNWRLPVADGAGHALELEELLVHPGVRRLTALLQQVR